MMTRAPLRHAAAAAVLAALAGCAWGDEATPTPTPIIAELVGAPDNFIGRRILVYGLVVESPEAGSRFLLQDVSQVPLRIVGPEGSRIPRGSQLMVLGKLRRNGGELEIAAERLTPAQVVAGGGCC